MKVLFNASSMKLIYILIILLCATDSQVLKIKNTHTTNSNSQTNKQNKQTIKTNSIKTNLPEVIKEVNALEKLKIDDSNEINRLNELNELNQPTKDFNFKEILLIPLLSVAIGVIISALILTAIILLNK